VSQVAFARLRKRPRPASRYGFQASLLSNCGYGVAKSTRIEANTARVETLFAGPLHSLAFEEEDGRVAGSLRATMEGVGRPIGAYDLLIAGQARRHRITLVTANVREFSRVKGLSWEDWGRS
jgi:tRNA(fMet)-specific endonuclease VapC